MKIRFVFFPLLSTISFFVLTWSTAHGQPLKAPPKADKREKRDTTVNPLPIVGRQEYQPLFLKVLEAVAEDYKITYADRYQGRVEGETDSKRIENQPVTRQRISVLVEPSIHEKGSYTVEVRVYKEREDSAAEAVILRRLAKWGKSHK